MSTFAEVLKEFKSIEAPESIIPLLEDVKLRNALVAWKSVTITYASTVPCSATEELARWEWMWGCVDVDLNGFGVVAGCKGQESHVLFERLRGLRLIYPDGTICGHAKSLLSVMIMEKLSKGKKRGPKTAES